MYKVFVEYKVSPENQEAYIAFIRETHSRYPHMELLEAADQESLFLEVWQLQSEGEYDEFKQNRLQVNHKEWSVMHSWVVGGVSKINIWRFQCKL